MGVEVDLCSQDEHNCNRSKSVLVSPSVPYAFMVSAQFRLALQNWMTSLPEDEAVDLIKDAFVAAGERDIYTVSIMFAPCMLGRTAWC